jgi:hypothetical protein
MLVSTLLISSTFLFQADEMAKDFKKFFRKEKDPSMRVELVYSLEGEESVSIAAVLIPVLTDKQSDAARAARIVLSGFRDHLNRLPLLEVVEEGKKDGRIAAILHAASDMRWRDFSEAGRTYLESDDPECRLWAVNLCGNLKNYLSIESISVILASDPNGIIRAAAVQALEQMGLDHEDTAAPPLIAALNDELSAVNVAACVALRTVRSKQAIGPLVNLLATAQGRLSEEVWPTLVAITDNQFNDNPQLWSDWWQRAKGNYELPSLAQIEKSRSARAVANAEYHPTNNKTEGSFMGIETSSRQIVFVIDVSGSMAEEVISKDDFRERGFTQFTKLDIVREELARSIDSLGDDVIFNVHSYASNVYSWRNKPVKANSLNKKSAIAWVSKLQPLSDKSGKGEQGRTNSYGGLMAGLGVQIDPKKRAVVTGGVLDDSELAADTMFFLSDGKPTAGLLIDTRDIEQAIADVNRFRKVVIHTLSIGNFSSGFLSNLAQANGGVFVDLGR